MSQIIKWIRKLFEFLRLTHEKEDDAVVYETISKGVVFRGTNLWILIFAILVASVGLNMNSTAVVIGAMLISPLMGPITGIGYSVATYNYPLFQKALYNYGFATSAALVTSILYFTLTPIRTEHAEILSRTSPTIYDVLIALFGGLAGILATSSKLKGNVIPGVAIATALMPPLCTAGYGISIGNFSYFFGALYLYLINSVFIALSAMVVSQMLNFPKQASLLSREIKNKNILISVIIVITVVPSFYLGYTLVQKEKFVAEAEHFVSEIGLWEGNFLLSNTIDAKDRKIELIFGGDGFDEKTTKRLKDKAKDLGLEDVELVIEQGLKIQDYQKLQDRNKAVDEVSAELDRLKSTLMYKERTIDSLKSIPEFGETILNEINTIYPSVNSCSYAESWKYVDSLKKAQKVSMIYFELKKRLSEDDTKKIHKWLEKRLKTDQLIVEMKFPEVAEGVENGLIW